MVGVIGIAERSNTPDEQVGRMLLVRLLLILER